ncbi:MULTISPECIES: hypothetical protein [unclassified Streptomyces]|uniref:hypothetical protein n=1 Tax=unclassified Streptomyces TaxID=2593676 RepID=UPI002E33142A|nr:MULTISPECIES: hypothetical protein [unclassified Streptomyces]WUC66412.1 hypothetical protein OG861_20495 [Streptomyces sp. NBC_00539]
MDNALLALAGTTIAVAGTLLAPVLSQRLVARTESHRFERQERAADAQWAREQRAAELDKRRACYVTSNSGYRRYRIELMKYLWLVHRAEVTVEARTVLEEARHAMHAAFAEAQMAASDAVLAELDSMSRTLAAIYDGVLRLEEADSAPEGAFEEMRTALLQANEQWMVMRGAMRADLGVAPPPG